MWTISEQGPEPNLLQGRKLEWPSREWIREGPLGTLKLREVPEGSLGTLKLKQVPVEGFLGTLKLREVPGGSLGTVKLKQVPREGSLGTLKLRLVPGFDTGKKFLHWVTRGAAAVPTDLSVQPQGWPANAFLSTVELPVQTRCFSCSFLRDKKNPGAGVEIS